MKTLFQITVFIAFALITGSCKTSSELSDTHNSKNSLDWAGIYKGTAAIEGKKAIIVITLNNDLTYYSQMAIINETDKLTESKGSFTWNKAGSEITIKDSNTGNKTSYKVGENSLKKTVLASPAYSLQKIQLEDIIEKYWRLIEINGKPVKMDELSGREPFIILKKEDNRVNANGGCNTLTGSYEISQMNRIKFSQMASTMMACMNMEIETELKKVLETADNYTLSADGRNLSLNRARMAPLARFEVVYLR